MPSVIMSKVHLLKVPLEDDMRNTYYFATKEAQTAYFNSRILVTYNNVSYQSETRTFRCPAIIDNVREFNYIMWQNTKYSDKWFYAFIKKLTYVSSGYTDIEFEVDPLQTYMFDYTVQKSFIEREHTNNDTIGENILPENLELGDYVKNSVVSTPLIGPSTMWYAIGVSEVIGTLSKQPASFVNGLPNGLFYIFTDNVSALHTVAKMYDADGKANALYSMFVFPKEILNINGSYAYQPATWEYSKGSWSSSTNVYVPTSSNIAGKILTNQIVYRPSRVGKTYTPRNQKLYTFPYCYFNITNNSGTTVTYRYEDFDGDPKFDMDGVLNVGCSTKLYPTNYKNMSIFTGDFQDNPYDYGITGGKYPTISWNSDSYTNWLTQNAVNIAIGVAGTALSTTTSLALGNVAGAGTSFLNGVGNSVAQVYQASLMPDQARGNTNVGDLNFTKHKNKFTVIPLSIKPQIAEVIDDYFDLFGYKTNRLKLPNIAHRENWWYIKTINANITGDIPNDELNKIKEAYNNGLTFWRNPSNFLNYSVSNGIV